MLPQKVTQIYLLLRQEVQRQVYIPNLVMYGCFSLTIPTKPATLKKLPNNH